MHQEPQQEHRWLEKLVGEWTFESECSMGPDQPPMRTTGTEAVRSFGSFWTVAEAQGGPADGWRSVMTLGYDSQKNRFVGVFVATMMTWMWVYEGSLDPAGKVLTLNTEGPDITDGKIKKYQDIIEVIGDEERTLSSQMLGDDGLWHPFMEARYRRRK